jgi:hypothetical protein
MLFKPLAGALEVLLVERSRCREQGDDLGETRRTLLSYWSRFMLSRRVRTKAEGGIMVGRPGITGVGSWY